MSHERTTSISHLAPEAQSCITFLQALKDGALKDFDAYVTRLAQENLALQEAIDVATKRITELESNVSTSDAKIVQLNSTIASQNKDIQKLLKTIDRFAFRKSNTKSISSCK